MAIRVTAGGAGVEAKGGQGVNFDRKVKGNKPMNVFLSERVSDIVMKSSQFSAVRGIS